METQERGLDELSGEGEVAGVGDGEVARTRGAGEFEGQAADGPFLESKEYLAGFWIIAAPDLDVALKLATEGSKACNRKIEVRPFL